MSQTRLVGPLMSQTRLVGPLMSQTRLVGPLMSQTRLVDFTKLSIEAGIAREINVECY